MQNLNHQAVEKLELSRRSRFYQSTMDMDHLDRGRSYRELPNGKVLFLCTFDPFGLGYAKYSFQNRCEENKELCLRDGTEKIFYNCVSSSEEVPEHLKELYDYIRTGRAGNALTRKIEEAVGRARRNEEWRSEYMKVFFVKHFSPKRASEFPVFVKGISLLSAGHSYASRRMRACSIR